MNNKKQYYTNLSSNEKSIESRDGSKVLMDSNGNVLFTTARRPEYIDPLREDYYQGNIDLNPDEDGSYFFVGTEQVIIDQQGNTNQDTILEPETVESDQQESSNNIESVEPEFGKYSIYSDDNGLEPGTFVDLRYEEPVDTYNPPPPVKEDWVAANWTATTRASLLRNWPANKPNIIAPPYYIPFNDLQKATLTRLANIELDIWNPYRIKQPVTAYSRNLEGTYLNTRLGYERPYYTEITAVLAKSFPKKDESFTYDITEYLELFTPPRSIKPNSLIGINTGYNPSWLQNTEYGKERINKVKTKEELEKDYEKLYLALLKYSGGNIELVKKFTYVSKKFIAAADIVGIGGALGYVSDDGSTPWSAFFISWLVNNVDRSFPRGENGQSHYNYAYKFKPSSWELFPLPYYGDKLNRTSNGRSVKVKLDIGDILIAPREGISTSSHGDMVYDIDLKNKKAYLIGGNVDDTVMITPVNIDENGFYSPEQPYRTTDEKVSVDTQTYVTYLVALKKVK